MGSVIHTLSAEEIQQAQQQAQAIAAASSLVVQCNQFVFFAAFDGTNNIRTNPGFSNDPQPTSVGQLAYQAESAAQGNQNIGVGYYPGPGTPGTLFGSSALPMQVTQEAIDTANRAYERFRIEAIDWLENNPNGSITTVITGFSRGGPAGVVFAQLLNERGLISNDGITLFQPGEIDVSAMVLFDPVSTGFSGDLSIPANVNRDNAVVLGALDEYRVLFKLDDYSADPGIEIFSLFGNHGDVGGFYDQGLGSLYLEGATGFFQNAGFLIADVPAERQFNPDGSVVIHSEGVDGYGNRIWDEYGTRGTRLTRPIGSPYVPRIITTCTKGVSFEILSEEPSCPVARALN